MKILVVVDMQKDFIDGSLGTKDAVARGRDVVVTIRGCDGTVSATRDTHAEDYLESAEGKHLPVVHCVKDTPGWQIDPEVSEALGSRPEARIIDKPTFGSVELGEYVKQLNDTVEPVEKITLVGLCTDICVISNALLLKAYLPEVPIEVDISCCAGVTPESHEQAAEAMKMCQIEIV